MSAIAIYYQLTNPHFSFRVADYWKTSSPVRLCTVNGTLKSHPVVKTILTIVAIISAVPIWMEVVGTAAWNGVNFAMATYLFVSSAGLLALIASLYSPWSQSAIFRWITWSGAIGIACLGLVFSAGFAFWRDPQVPWNSRVGIGPIEIPALAVYGFAVASCAIQAVLQFPNRSGE